MNIVLLGAPGSGKGAQAEKIVAKHGIAVIGTGNMLREEIKKNSELGKKAKQFMDAGQLVPDDIILGIVNERLNQPDCKNGFIMDGVPRTIAQAEALGKITDIDIVLDLEVSEKVIIERLSGRRFCPNCLAVYHVINTPPKKNGICDKCGSRLEQREDDRPEAVKKRLQEYALKTKPLKEFYKKKGILKKIDGGQPIEKVFSDIENAIG
jgi:adenylate kinase